MTAAMYALAAVLIAALSTRAWFHGRDDPARQAFVGLGWSLGLAFLAFPASFLPGLDDLRGVWTVAGTVAPAYLWRTVDAMFPRHGGRVTPGGVLLAGAWLVGMATAVTHVVWVPTSVRLASTPEIIAGLWAFSTMGLVLLRLRRARLDAVLPAARTRLDVLTGLTTLGSAMALFEWGFRHSRTPIDPASLPFFERGLEMQGILPPTSAMVATAVVYVLYHALQAQRLVALQELLARLSVLGAWSAVLTSSFAFTLWWVELSRFPFHASFLLFLVAALNLSFWTSVREPMLRLTTRWLNPPGEELDDALRALHQQLPRRVVGDGLARTLVETLHGSGRFDAVGVWLFAQNLGAYRRVAGQLPGALEAVAPDRSDPALGEERPFVYRSRMGPGAPPAKLALLEATGADLIFPFRDGTSVLGWLAVVESPHTDGLSPEERLRMRGMCDVAARNLAHIESFRRLSDERRLAALGAMSAGLAHEIRNPLAGLKGAAQFLQDEPLDGVSAEMLDIVVDETERLERVVSEFLTFARPIHSAAEPTDLRGVTRRVTRLVRAEGLDEGVSVAAVVCEEPVVVHADAHQIVQVLLNLVRNALDALDGAGRVTLTVDRLGERGRVVVADDGPGIPPDVLDQLFTPFFTTKTHGTGLGMPICKRIVDAHGGTLAVRTAPEDGTAISVWLPLDLDASFVADDTIDELDEPSSDDLAPEDAPDPVAAMGGG